MRINENTVDIISHTFGIEPLPSPVNQRAGLHVATARNLSTAAKSLSLLNFVNQLREKNLILDFSLIGDPFISQGTIMMKSRGEIAW